MTMFSSVNAGNRLPSPGRVGRGFSPSATAMAVGANHCDQYSSSDTEEFLDSSANSSQVSFSQSSTSSSTAIPSPARLPTFHASGQGVWCAVVSYDACCRLCLRSWAQDRCMEAPYFLNDECAILREAFGWVLYLFILNFFLIAFLFVLVNFIKFQFSVFMSFF
jgi:hypothetical protein